MQEDQISVVYARALLAAAIEKDALDAVHEESRALRGQFDDGSDLRLFVESARIELSKKREVFERALKGKVSDTLLNFILLTFDKGREAHLPSIFDKFSQLYDEQTGLVRAEVTTAVALEESTLESIRNRLADQLGRRVELNNVVDSEVLGGLVVRFDGMVADGSLQRSLAEIREKMTARKFGNELIHEN